MRFAPTLLNEDIDLPFIIMPGDEWELQLEPYDVDGDLATVDIDYSGDSALWIEFDQRALKVHTAKDLTGQQLGTYLITIVLEDFDGRRAEFPIIVEVFCPDVGHDHPLCKSDEETQITSTPTTITVTDSNGDITVVSSNDISNISNDSFFTADYDVIKIIPIEKTVEPADPALEEDDDFVDEIGILSPEQGRKAIEDIIAASDDPVVFEERLIPTGAVVEI